MYWAQEVYFPELNESYKVGRDTCDQINYDDEGKVVIVWFGDKFLLYGNERFKMAGIGEVENGGSE